MAFKPALIYRTSRIITSNKPSLHFKPNSTSISDTASMHAGCREGAGYLQRCLMTYSSRSLQSFSVLIYQASLFLLLAHWSIEGAGKVPKRQSL